MKPGTIAAFVILGLLVLFAVLSLGDSNVFGH